MKILAAVVSCAQHLNRNTAVLETWGRENRLFFTASFANPSHRTIEYSIKLFTGRDLEVPDDYAHLPQKVKAVCEYASDNEFDFLFKADSDTYCFVQRLLDSGFESHDYVGWTSGLASMPPCDEYASGGAGYWLSRKAFSLVAKAPLTDDTCEDRWVGRVLYDAGILVHRDTRYGVPQSGRNPFTDNELLTWHPCPPKRMYELNGVWGG